MKTFKYVNHLSQIKIFSLMFILSIFTASSVSAQTNTILPGNWNDPSNWDNNIPTSGSSAIINHNMILNMHLNVSKNAVYQINSSGSLIDPPGGGAFSILIQQKNSGGILDVNGKVEVEGDLVIQQSGVLYVRSNDTLIVGDAFFFHDAEIYIEEFGVMIVNGNLEMKQKNTTQLDGNLYVNGNITAAQQSEINGTGKVQATGTINLGNSATFFGNTNNCSPGPCEYGTGSGLPVELLSFTASHTASNNISIDWITASEINNDYFLIEKSTDGLRFEVIQSVKGNGTSASLNKYSISTTKESTLTYYRLTQVDYNGSSKTYNPVALEPTTRYRSKEFKIYPNPAKGNDQLSLEIYTPTDFIGMEIRDMSGKVIVQETDFAKASNLQLDSRFESGIYMVLIKNNSNVMTEKLIITK